MENNICVKSPYSSIVNFGDVCIEFDFCTKLTNILAQLIKSKENEILERRMKIKDIILIYTLGA